MSSVSHTLAIQTPRDLIFVDGSVYVLANTEKKKLEITGNVYEHP